MPTIRSKSARRTDNPASVIRSSAKSPPLILTIGHSTRSIQEFLCLLKVHEVLCVGDVRTVPRSRHNPQFSRDALPKSLKEAGIGYVHLPKLGGLRRPNPRSANMGWRNASFRGFADYMQTPDFEAGLKKVLQLGCQARLALMCAEALPWRCHRSLIADALLARKVRVEHIMSRTNRRAHTLTPFARIRASRVSYPGSSTPPKRSTDQTAFTLREAV